jgi:glycosyltransferase involved in cell wall biosynthesis
MISVCIATYNGARYIEQQLQSIMTQLGPLDEVVVSDDGSTDGTTSILSKFGDPRIRLIIGDIRLGVIKNFERALGAASGDFIFLCDQDDIWLQGKVDRCLEALKDHHLVVTNCIVVDESLNELSPSFFDLRKSGPGTLRNLWKNSYLGCCMAMRSSLLNGVLPFPRQIAMHDWWIGLVAEQLGSVCFINEPFSLYRRHSSNASPTATKSITPMAIRLKWRFDLARHLLARRLAADSSQE